MTSKVIANVAEKARERLEEESEGARRDGRFESHLCVRCLYAEKQRPSVSREWLGRVTAIT
jgi:hypothetical protein